MASDLIKYPEARREDVVDGFFGTPVADPYRWLEDPDAPEVQAWVKSQQELFASYVGEVGREKERIAQRLTHLMDYPKINAPWFEGKPGGKWSRFYTEKNTGLQSQSVMFTMKAIDDEPVIFMNPNELSVDGTVSLNTWAFSPNGRYFAYGLSSAGSDWQTIHFRYTHDDDPDRDTMPLTETLRWLKWTSLAWLEDETGLFYSRYPTPKIEDEGTSTAALQGHAIWFHRLGTAQEEDSLIYTEPLNPDWGWNAEVTHDGQTMLIYGSKDSDHKNTLFYAPLPLTLSGASITPIKLIEVYEAEFRYLANDGSLFYFKTNHNAARYKVIAIDFTRPGREYWWEVLPEHSKDVLASAVVVNSVFLLVCYIRDVIDVLELRALEDGRFLYQFPLALGTVASLNGHRSHPYLTFKFTSYLTPGIIYCMTLPPTLAGPFVAPPVWKAVVVPGFDRSRFDSLQVFYPSKDGTLVPLFIVGDKALLQRRQSDTPVFLYGYGGFGVSIQPYFSTTRLIWMAYMGGLFCVANIRGGGEYGDAWHDAGIKDRRQNVFDDFIAAAQYLINEKYTSSALLTINGSSNGGLLVGACVNQRPDLFGVAIADVGVMDMLRYHKFTIGHFWTSDYGSAEANKAEFDCLLSYSPVHSVKAAGAQYPAILLLTADHDDRVSPLHSYKYAAVLQHALGSQPWQRNPLLIRIESQAGHGAGKPTAKHISEWADVFAFLTRHLGLQWRD